MNFAGHAKNWNFLLSEASQNRLPPAYLFYGSPGIGKKLVATTLVQSVFCQQSRLKKPCGVCVACTKVLANQHPDFYFIEPDGKQIKIDQIRELQRKLSRSALEAPLKIVILNEAHRLTQQAANSLLKTLEEPPRDTLFILIAPALFGILPTIRSRCRRVYFTPPLVEELAPFLSKVVDKPIAEVSDILREAHGSAEFACQMMQEGFGDVLHEMMQVVTSKSFSFGNNVKTIEKWSGQEAGWDMLLQGFKRKYFDSLQKNQAWQLVPKMDLIEAARRDIERNVNKQLVLENLMIDMRSL